MAEKTKFLLELDLEEKDFLLNFLKRKQLRCEHMLNNPSRYDDLALQRAEKTYKLTSSILEKLGNVRLHPKMENKEKESLEDRLNKLEVRVDQMQVLLKKLVAYHSGDIS